MLDDEEIRNRSMWNLSGWRQADCVERDGIIMPDGVRDESFRCFSSLTDMDGEYGEPIIYTEWGLHDPDRAIIRDYRWPKSERTCEHWVPKSGSEPR